MTAHIARKLFPDAPIVPEQSRFPEQPGFAHDHAGALDALGASGALDAMAADFFKAGPGRGQGSGARTLAIRRPPRRLADALIVALARALRRRGDATRLVVFGHCLDDLAAMAPGNVFVAGAVRARAYDRLLGPYAITDLMCVRGPVSSGGSTPLAFRRGLARAGFDWSSGAARFAAGRSGARSAPVRPQGGGTDGGLAPARRSDGATQW